MDEIHVFCLVVLFAFLFGVVIGAVMKEVLG